MGVTYAWVDNPSYQIGAIDTRLYIMGIMDRVARPQISS